MLPVLQTSQLEIDVKETRLWAACLIPLQLLAIASTIFRVIYRKRNHGLWWDDRFALLSLVLAFICFLTPWLSLIQGIHPTLRIASGWLFMLSSLLVVWMTRTSLALSIARIMPRHHPIFSLVICIVLFFGVLWVTEVILLAVGSARNTAWSLTPPYVYHTTSHPTAIFLLCADLIADILIIVIPLRIFWNAKLESAQLFLVKIGFAASILTSAAGVICAIFALVRAPSVKTNVTAGVVDIWVCFALITCNALVIITFLYRYFRRRPGEQAITVPSTQTPLVVTEIFDNTVGGRHTFSY